MSLHECVCGDVCMSVFKSVCEHRSVCTCVKSLVSGLRDLAHALPSMWTKGHQAWGTGQSGGAAQDGEEVSQCLQVRTGLWGSSKKAHPDCGPALGPTEAVRSREAKE